MKNNFRKFGLYLAVVLSVASCGDKRPSAAALEVEKAKADFPRITAWVNSNRMDLAELAAEIGRQPTFRSLSWSRPPEYFTAILRSNTATERDVVVFQGPLNNPEWPQETRLAIEKWHARLKKAGCHGFEDEEAEWSLRLFLDVNLYIAIPVPTNSLSVEHYEKWARNGPDPRGDICSGIGGGWYLCTERR
jgi:hypothetical protein